MIRRAGIGDLDALIDLENCAFETDRLSRRSFRHMLTRGHAATLVDEGEQGLRGYVLLLFHRGTALARLYSIAVSEQVRGLGVGRALIAAAELEALEQGCVTIRSEVRKDNAPSLALFAKHGYRKFDEVDHYYEDGMGAFRLEKGLDPELRGTLARVPYYRQTLDFTCGAAALMMAMKALRPEMTLDRQLELQLWREATSIFMTSGHGGCGPYGLALAARRRGFGVEIHVKEQGVFLGDSVRSAEKREVMRLVEHGFLAELETLGVAVEHRGLGAVELGAAFEAGAIAVVLVSSFRMYRERIPHWMVVTGLDARFVYIHDPFVDEEEDKSAADSMNVPIARADFERMARYGKSGQRAVLLLTEGS